MNSEVTLIPTRREDIETFFQFQTQPEGIEMAAFTPKDPNDREAYTSKWYKLIKDHEIHIRTILYNGRIVGSVTKFMMEGNAEITYWLDKKYWGLGITSSALQQFLSVELIRPIYARVAFDNLGSQKVLEKNGFKRIREEMGFANARGEEIVEYVYILK